MYLYTPIDGRSVTIENYTISSTGMQFDEPVPCLEEVVGSLLVRTSTLETETYEEPEAEIPLETYKEPKLSE